MINLEICRINAKFLAEEAVLKSNGEELMRFYKDFDLISNEYKIRYQLSSNAINLRQLISFKDWFPKVLKIKDILSPIIVDKMVNKGDLYSLSLYTNLFADTNYIPDIHKIHSENDLAIIMGCHWVENYLKSRIRMNIKTKQLEDQALSFQTKDLQINKLTELLCDFGVVKCPSMSGDLPPEPEL